MSLDGRSRQALARYAPLMVSDYHQALAHRALVWSLQRTGAVDLDRQAKEAFLSSAFEIFCAPPAATPEENFLSMKFLLVFFRADDAPATLLDEFVPWMDGERECATEALRTYYQELSRDFEAMGRDARGFHDALRGMCASMQIEKRADKATMSEAEYRRLRTHTVAVPAYTECWRVIRGISFSPELGAALSRSRLRDRAAEIVYLVNDIGSLDRDEEVAREDPGNVDPNFVLLRMRALGDRDAALAEVIERENRLIAEFRQAEQGLLQSEHGADPALRAYLEILRSTINGNLATTKHLGPMRYPAAASALARVHVV